MIQFRTMRPDAEREGGWTKPATRGVTRLGRLHAQTNWDEVPKPLINVFTGR